VTAPDVETPRGYVVLWRKKGRKTWRLDWDGEVYPTPEAASESLAEALKCNYEAEVTANRPGLGQEEEVPW
jgi:hypothetical protein